MKAKVCFFEKKNAKKIKMADKSKSLKIQLVQGLKKKPFNIHLMRIYSTGAGKKINYLLLPL